MVFLCFLHCTRVTNHWGESVQEATFICSPTVSGGKLGPWAEFFILGPRLGRVLFCPKLGSSGGEVCGGEVWRRRVVEKSGGVFAPPPLRHVSSPPKGVIFLNALFFRVIKKVHIVQQ